MIARRIMPAVSSLVFLLLISTMVFIGCGGGSGSESGQPGGAGATLPGGGGNDEGGGGGTTTGNPPAVVLAKPEGNAVSVTDPILVAFDKPMKLSTFPQALKGPDIGYEPACVDDECKTIRFNRIVNLEYDTTYLLELSTQVQDQEGIRLQTPYSWSFKTQPFVSSFSNITLDGMTENAGECTAIGMDNTGTLHIVYYSDFEGRPKHAFCLGDCGKIESWSFEPIDHPDQNSADGKVGRDINLAIAGDILHVSYRDLPSQPGVDGAGILKYATGIRKSDNTGWSWTPVIVDDTDFGVSDTYIAVQDDRIHISYRRVGGGGHSDAIKYATAICNPDCADPALSVSAWNAIEVDTGGRAGAPNHIIVRGTAVHLTYYAGGVLKYAECAANCAASSDSWQKTAVDDDDGGTDDVGSENSLATDANGRLHSTYRNSSNGDLKYAFCDSDCTVAQSWQKVVVDTEGAGSTQIKIDSNGTLHVSYRDDRNKDLKYATCSSENCLNPADWSIFRVDALGEVGWDTYLEVANGAVHISYRDSGNQALKYAWGAADR